MKRLILFSLAAVVGVLLLSPGSASAQMVYPPGPPAYGPGFQTPLSPYLNLLRGGMTAANYYIGTIPEFQRRQDARVLQGQINTALNYSTGVLGQAQLTAEEAQMLRPLKSAGHPTSFGNTGPYFSGGGMAAGMGGAGMATRPPFPQPAQQGRQGPLGAMPPRNPMTGVGVGGGR
jgi:hypothetical protein